MRHQDPNKTPSGVSLETRERETEAPKGLGASLSVIGPWFSL